MKKKKGFTLVELLAVIVILAVVLIIAVPQITSTIKETKLRSMEDSAKLIATNAEKDYLAQKTLNANYNVTSIPCTDVAKLSEDYSNCSITYDANGTATVKLKGAAESKYSGIKCSGTKDSINCVETDPNSKDWVYARKNITSADEGVKDFNSFNSKRTFIRFNEDDLNERYTCIRFISDAEPACISANAYATRNNTDSEWKKLKPVFTRYGSNNCKEQNSKAICSYGSTWLYKCETSDGYSMCFYDDDNYYYACYLYTDGTITCN